MSQYSVPHLTVGECVNVEYTSLKNETKIRTIVPTSTVNYNVSTIDVTDLSDDERQEVIDLYLEYDQYRRERLKQLFNFETWVEHTKNKTVTPKWRALGIERIGDITAVK